jgi:hypothetical protein
MTILKRQAAEALANDCSPLEFLIATMRSPLADPGLRVPELPPMLPPVMLKPALLIVHGVCPRLPPRLGAGLRVLAICSNEHLNPCCQEIWRFVAALSFVLRWQRGYTKPISYERF